MNPPSFAGLPIGFVFYEKKYDAMDMEGIMFHCDTPEHFLMGAAITTQDSAFTNTKAGDEPSIGACPEET